MFFRGPTAAAYGAFAGLFGVYLTDQWIGKYVYRVVPVIRDRIKEEEN